MTEATQSHEDRIRPQLIMSDEYSAQPCWRSVLSPFSISRRIASDREGLGSGWRSIQAVIAASSSAERRTVLTGSLPVAGRPRVLFCISAIDQPLD